MKQKGIAVKAIETRGLGKHYRSFWALNDCTITVPKGSMSALVGPNGAGKTTLLKLLAGLSVASTGSSLVFGEASKQNTEYLAEVGYLAQEVPLYKQLSVKKHLIMGAHLNVRWDRELAERRLRELGIPLDRLAGKLSGGQRAQVALVLALAKKPRLLLLDEPVAALDPLARDDFLSSLARAVADADGELTVVMSSHLLADLERICDHLILLASGQTQLCDDIEHIVSTHKQLVGSRHEQAESDAYTVVKRTDTQRETMLLVRLHDSNFRDQHWRIHDVDLEEIVLAYMGQNRQKLTETTVEGDLR